MVDDCCNDTSCQCHANSHSQLALLAKNKAWASRIHQEDETYFHKLASQQNPDYLWFGCADARVPANQIVDLEPGKLFVHRNIANQVIHTDFNCLSVLQYAVDVLQIEHIIVCGHYGCGGIQAALGNEDHGLVDNWLRHIKDIYMINKEEIDGLRFRDQKENRLCELNVIAQVRNLSQTKIIQRAWERGQNLAVHGWVYALSDGVIKDLEVSVNSIRCTAI